MYINMEMVLSSDILPYPAARTKALITARYGKLKKCVVFDPGKTIWGGIIGNEDLENIQVGALNISKAFTEFQYRLKKLKNRGVIWVSESVKTEICLLTINNG